MVLSKVQVSDSGPSLPSCLGQMVQGGILSRTLYYMTTLDFKLLHTITQELLGIGAHSPPPPRTPAATVLLNNLRLVTGNGQCLLYVENTD